MKYIVLDLVGENCITLQEGQKIFDVIDPELKAGHPIELNFEGVNIFASPFFNAAIGQLYRDISSDKLNALLSISKLVPYANQLLSRVITNAKRYYSESAYRSAVDEVLNRASQENE